MSDMNFLEVLKEEDGVDMQSRRSGHYFCISRFTLHSSKFQAGALTCPALVFMQAVSSVVLIRTTRLIGLSVLPSNLKPHNSFVVIGGGKMEQNGRQRPCSLIFPDRLLHTM